jgi:hypothetical protein
MAKVLVVATQGRQGTWAVYAQEDSPRAPGTVVQTTGPLVGSVASWAERYLRVDLHRERYAAVSENCHRDARVNVKRSQQ